MKREDLKRILAKAKNVSSRGAEIIRHAEVTDWNASRDEDSYEAQIRIFIRAEREDGLHVDAATGEACSEPITRELGVPAKIQGAQYRAFWRKANHGLLTARKRVSCRLAVERAVAILVEVERSLAERVGKTVRVKIVARPDRVDAGTAAPAAGGDPGGEPAPASVS